MEFEWDEAKAPQTWLAMASISAGALAVFEDPMRIEMEDDRFDYGEKRFKAIGIVWDIVLVVIFADRGDSIRIISARKAECHERKAYYKNHC